MSAVPLWLCVSVSRVCLSVFNLSGPRKTINNSNRRRATKARHRHTSIHADARTHRTTHTHTKCHGWCVLLCWWQDEMCNYPLFLLIPSVAIFPAFCSPVLSLFAGRSILFSRTLHHNHGQFRLTHLKTMWGRESTKTYLQMIDGE